jgi:hypothetical protein
MFKIITLLSLNEELDGPILGLKKHETPPFGLPHFCQAFLQNTVYAVYMLESLSWTSITCLLLFRCLTTITTRWQPWR